jgi:ribosome-associated heat shock protein Hsp15
MRLDQWLWAIRLYKSRGLAAEAIKGGHVKLNGEATKPGREPKPAEIVTARIGIMTRTVRVVGQFAEDLTPAEEFEKLREFNLAQPSQREKGAGRPTKRERRVLDEFAEEESPL